MLRLTSFGILLIFCWLNAPAQHGSRQVRYKHVEYNQAEKGYVSGLFKSDNAYSMVVEDDPAATAKLNIFNYLQGRIPGLLICEGPTYNPVVTYRSNKTALFLDEMPVDASLLMTVNMDDIALIKVFRPPFIGAVGGGPGGAIAVYTKRGDGDEDKK